MMCAVEDDDRKVCVEAFGESCGREAGGAAADDYDIRQAR
jgi:hypothetical protein